MSKIRVYKYGLLPPTENAQLVREQMFAAHRYHNTLIEIERGRRSAIRSVTRECDANIRKLESQLAEAEELEIKIAKEIKTQHSEMRSRTSTQTDKEDLKTVRAKKKECKKQLIEARKAAKQNAKLILELDLIKKKEKQLIHSAREYCGVYWGTYLLIEDAMEASRKMPLYDGIEDNDPRFVSWKNKGAIGVQLQGGLESNKALGTDTRIRITPVDDKAFYAETRADRRKAARTTLRLRVQSDKAKPVWAEWPMLMHRPLPQGGNIKSATVHLKRFGSREEWSLTLTVDLSNVTPASSTANGAVAIDIGWRDMKDAGGQTTHFRLGKWRDENETLGEIKLDTRIITGIRKASDIKSIRDINFNLARASLIEWMKNNESPDWLKDKAKTLPQWRSIARLIRLVKFWSNNRFDGDKDIFGIAGKWNTETKSLIDGTGLAGWRYHDFHLWNWECSQRTKAIRGRKECYRIFAAYLASKYLTLVLEEFDLRDVSKNPEPDDEDDNQRARGNKTLAAPSELRLALVNAFQSRGGEVVKVNPKGTSYTCHLCSSKENLDSTTHIHTCSKCKKTWDREDNATANMLALWREQLGDVQSAGGARIDGNHNENEEVQETRYQRRNRAKQEKLVCEASARKELDKAAESLNL